MSSTGRRLPGADPGEGPRRLLDPEERESTTVRVAIPGEGELERGEAGDAGTAPALRRTLDLRERYEDLGVIARGGMGTVRRALDHWILRQVAVKRREVTRSPLELARFIEEVQITGQLDHPNIVPVHDLELDQHGIPCKFVMKLVQGKTLRQLLTAHPMDALHGDAMEEFLQIFLKVCDAVAFAHSRGVVHRDIKPDNVMVGSFGQVYVMDWGIAVLCEGGRPSDTMQPRQSVRVGTGRKLAEPPGTLSGTPAYMAPEQAQGRNDEVDARTDVFGLGGILYYFLTSSAPFVGQDASDELILAMGGHVVPPEQRAEGRPLPPGLCRIAMRALAAEPADRYPSVAALVRDVEDFLRGGGWFESRRFESGEAIVTQGEHADCAYIVVAGCCRVTRVEDGAARPISTLGPGEVFGETGILANAPRTASVSALTEVTVLVVTRQTLERELGRHRWLHAIVDAVVSRSMQQSQELAALRLELERAQGLQPDQP